MHLFIFRPRGDWHAMLPTRLRSVARASAQRLIGWSAPPQRRFGRPTAQPAPRLRVAIDLAFSELMNSKELRSLNKQLFHSAAMNRGCGSPLDLYLTSFGSARLNADALSCVVAQQEKKAARDDSAYQDRPYATIVEESVSEHWDPNEVVYLTPDARVPLEKLNPQRIYVIGGLVDKTVRKKISLRRARELGVAVGRLPIGEHSPGLHPILTLPAVVRILAGVQSGEAWSEAIVHGAPTRQLKRAQASRRPPRFRQRHVDAGAIAGPDLTDADVSVHAPGLSEASHNTPPKQQQQRQRQRQQLEDHGRRGQRGDKHTSW